MSEPNLEDAAEELAAALSNNIDKQGKFRVRCDAGEDGRVFVALRDADAETGNPFARALGGKDGDKKPKKRSKDEMRAHAAARGDALENLQNRLNQYLTTYFAGEEAGSAESLGWRISEAPRSGDQLLLIELSKPQKT